MRRLFMAGIGLGTATSCHCPPCWRLTGGRWAFVDRSWRAGVSLILDSKSRPTRDRVSTTQDEELAVASDAPLRSARLPSHKQVIELLEGEFARAGFDIEDVVVDAATRPPRIVVIADGEEPPDLESIAVLSRSASELLDALDDSDPYVLEVTSRGAESPLTAERHYRRARGRKVTFELADGERLTGRLGEFGDGAVAVVVPAARRGTYAIRDVALENIMKAVVQVEFSAPSARELELAGLSGKEADA